MLDDELRRPVWLIILGLVFLFSGVGIIMFGLYIIYNFEIFILAGVVLIIFSLWCFKLYGDWKYEC